MRRSFVNEAVGYTTTTEQKPYIYEQGMMRKGVRLQKAKGWSEDVSRVPRTDSAVNREIKT